MRSALLAAAAAGCILAGVPAAARAQASAPDTCPSSAREPGTAIFEGSVVDRSTRVPLQNVRVRLTWFRRSSTRQSERTTETDRHGTFRFCDAPAATALGVVAGSGQDRSRAEALTLAEDERGSVQLELDAIYSRMYGRIIDHETGRPVAGASIDLGLANMRRITAEDGTFLMDSVPAGVYQIRVQHVAYAEVRDSIDVDWLARIELTIRLAPAAIPIDPIRVVVRSNVLELRGFYERQRRGLGTFLTRQNIDAMHPLAGTDILRRVPGIRLVRQNNWLGLIALGRGSCRYRFVIDGVRIHANYSMDEMPPTWIEGVEIYKGPSEVPIEFAGFAADPSGNCGVIVVWTRNRI